MWSGDPAFLSANYAALKTKTLDKYARADGLINPTGTGVAQDTPVVDEGSDFHDHSFFQPTSSVNLLGIYTLPAR